MPAVASVTSLPPACRAATEKRANPTLLLWLWLRLLIFVRDKPDAANRDLGAGRTQAVRSGPSGRDAARAAPRHGWRMAAGPRSIAGVRELRRSRSQTRSRTPWLLGGLFQVTRRRRNASAVRQNKTSATLNIGYTPRTKRHKKPTKKTQGSTCAINSGTDSVLRA